VSTAIGGIGITGDPGVCNLCGLPYARLDKVVAWGRDGFSHVDCFDARVESARRGVHPAPLGTTNGWCCGDGVGNA
jgi:hypothetical protein